jgi:hypothetical protein
MAATARGYALRAVDTSHGRADPGKCNVSVGKVNPQTTTINLFTVVGSIVCDLVGVVSTIFGAVAQHLTIGITGSPALIAAAPAVALNATAAGAVINTPSALGGALPAPVVATGAASSLMLMEVSNTIITLTSDASTTGAITWILDWVPLMPKGGASVTTN